MNARAPHSPSRAPGSHGFVTPFVILLVMIAGIFSIVMIQREGAQRRLVATQVRSYRSYHAGKGIREVTGGWIKSLTGQPIEQMVAEDGHALDINLPTGEVISVYLTDGQGSVLAEGSTLASADQDLLARLFAELEELPLPDPDFEGPLTRPVGPLAISLNTASESVLRAIARTISGKDKVTRFVETIMEARAANGTVTEADLNTASATMNLANEERAALSRLVTVKPELWMLEAILTPPPGSRDKLIRYRGLMTMGRTEGAAHNAGRTNTSIQPMGPFLTWDEVPVE